MADPGGKTALAQKPLSHLRRIELLPEHLERDAPACGSLFGIVHRAHAAAPEQSAQPVRAEGTGELRRLACRMGRGQGLAGRYGDGLGPRRYQRAGKEAGGAGLISGRKAFQRPMKEGVALLNAIQDVYLCDGIGLA